MYIKDDAGFTASFFLVFCSFCYIYHSFNNGAKFTPRIISGFILYTPRLYRT